MCVGSSLYLFLFINICFALSISFGFPPLFLFTIPMYCLFIIFLTIACSFSLTYFPSSSDVSCSIFSCWRWYSTYQMAFLFFRLLLSQKSTTFLACLESITSTANVGGPVSLLESCVGNSSFYLFLSSLASCLSHPAIIAIVSFRSFTFSYVLYYMQSMLNTY